MTRAGLRKAVTTSPLVRRALGGVFRVRAVRRIRRSGIFDTPWYEAETGMQFRSSRAAVRDYVGRGRAAGYSPHPLVWPSWITPDTWRRSWSEPTLRILHPRGIDMGSPLFDVARYVAEHPEAATHEYGPVAHFVTTSTPSTPLPTVDGRVLTMADLDRVSIAAARQRIAERALHRSALRTSWDEELQSAVLADAARAQIPVADLPLVSVVMPVRNRPGQLVEAVASVQAQSYPAWELVIVDDGSTDTTPEVIASLAEADPRVRHFSEDRLGVSGARNHALAEARGELIAFLDSDNEWDTDFLRVMVARMAQTGSRFAHSGVRGARDGFTWYRGDDGGLEELLSGNFIDLNAVVVERALIDEVGGFDEGLRRMVDWDLVIRLAQVERPALVPFVGVRYDDTHEGHERVTTTELRSWREVILAKHLIDWPALEVLERVPGLVSVVIPTFQDWEMTVAAVDAVLATTDERAAEVIVVDNGSRLLVWQMLNLMLGGMDRVRLVRRPVNDHFALGSDLGFAHGVGEYVLFLNNDTEVQPGWLPPLVAALDDPEAMGAQPLLLYPDRTIQCAGVVFPGPPGVAGLPGHFLIGHPAEDAERLGVVSTHALTGAALLMRGADAARLRGFDPLYTNGFEDIDLCMRAGGDVARRFRVVTGARVLHFESKTPGRRDRLGENRRLFAERWRGRLPLEYGELWDMAGFEVAHYDFEQTVEDPTTPRIARPVVVRRRTPDSPDSLRWAIKVPSPAGSAGDGGVDVALARRLARELSLLGQQVVVDRVEAHERSTSYLDDVTVTLRGPIDVAGQPGRVNVLWVIDRAELPLEELARYPVVMAAGSTWAATTAPGLGIPVTVLEPADPEKAARLLLDRVLEVRSSVAPR